MWWVRRSQDVIRSLKNPDCAFETLHIERSTEAGLVSASQESLPSLCFSLRHAAQPQRTHSTGHAALHSPWLNKWRSTSVRRMLFSESCSNCDTKWSLKWVNAIVGPRWWWWWWWWWWCWVFKREEVVVLVFKRNGNAVFVIENI